MLWWLAFVAIFTSFFFFHSLMWLMWKYNKWWELKLPLCLVFFILQLVNFLFIINNWLYNQGLIQTAQAATIKIVLWNNWKFSKIPIAQANCFNTMNRFFPAPKTLASFKGCYSFQDKTTLISISYELFRL